VNTHNRLLVFLILFILMTAVVGPVVYSGFYDLRAAQSALTEKNFSDAERLFESAARKLFWRNDLWEKAGLAAYNNGDQDNSISLLEFSRKNKLLSPLGWYTLGTDFWVKGDQISAISTWNSALKFYPSFAPIYDQLIPAYHEQRNYAAEQEVLTKRLAIGGNALAHYRLGLILTLSDQKRAEQEFVAAALDPQYKPVVTTLDFTLNAAGNEPNLARRYVVIGRGLGLVEEWGLASISFEKAVYLDNMNGEAWAWLGEARQHQGQDGSKELDKALLIDPRDAVIRALRGLYWKRRGQYTKALAEYQITAEIEPDNPAWQIFIGESSSLNGDLVAALSAYQKATTLVPGDATYWRLLAMFCSDNGVQVLSIGLPAAQKAAEISPDDPQVLDALGWSYLNAGYLYTAEQDLLRAIKVEPDFALAHIHLAETYLQQGDRASAYSELENARQLDRNGPSGMIAAQLLNQYFP
jgi:tetratricopeptide (TPR) repeat protein